MQAFRASGRMSRRVPEHVGVLKLLSMRFVDPGELGGEAPPVLEDSSLVSASARARFLDTFHVGEEERFFFASTRAIEAAFPGANPGTGQQALLKLGSCLGGEPAAVENSRIFGGA